MVFLKYTNNPSSRSGSPQIQKEDTGKSVTASVISVLDRTPGYSLQLDDEPYGAPPKNVEFLINPDFHDHTIFLEGNPQDVAIAFEHEGIWYYNHAGAIRLANFLGRDLPTLSVLNAEYHARPGIISESGKFKKGYGYFQKALGYGFPLSRLHHSHTSAFWISSEETPLEGDNFFALLKATSKKYKPIISRSSMERTFIACPVLFRRTAI